MNLVEKIKGIYFLLFLLNKYNNIYFFINIILNVILFIDFMNKDNKK